jgi:hypothetical protein
MPRRAGQGKSRAQGGSLDWWQDVAANDSQNVREWDIKQGVLADGLLAILASGRAVTFASSRNGLSISITVYDGDDRRRRWCEGPEQFDDAMAALVRHLGAAGAGADDEASEG